MPKILHTYRYSGRPWEILQSVAPEGFFVKTLDEPTYEQLLREVGDADYFLVSGRLPIDKAVLDAAPNLKMIQRTGVGTEMLDIDEIKRRGIPVYVNFGINARSVAEHTMALILGCMKRLCVVNAQVKNGVWKKQETGTSCHELYGKTVGIVGMGSIGRLVASYLNCFGAHVVYTDKYRLPIEKEKELNVDYFPSFINMLPIVDILTFHCPLTDENREMLNESSLSMMKPGSIVVNTARGKLIDETALYNSLFDGRIASAGLDVHFEEPIQKDSPLCKLNNVILSPHIAGLSYEAFYSMMKGAMDNIRAFEENRLDEISDKKLF